MNMNLKIHIGAGVCISMKSPFICVNIRSWYYNSKQNQWLPSQNGISMKKKEWIQFKSLIAELEQEYTPLFYARECITTHSSTFPCDECYPDHISDMIKM